MRVFIALLAVFFFITSAFTEILEETGNLSGLIFGSCSQCAYEHWTSHVVEGLARPGYNDYGPSYFDPQQNGFGRFRRLTGNAADQQTLGEWRQVFQEAVDGEWNRIDSMLAARENDWQYDLVHFWDAGEGREYYLLREQLDSSFSDNNVDSIATDNVVGGFRNGWGLYVFNPHARRPELILQAPHPEDDFMALPVAFEMFRQLGARVLMLAGAGREAVWDSLHPPFDNSKSLSDPSRNDTTPFGVCHQVFFDALYDSARGLPLTIQVHSYDHGLHGGLKDVQMSAFSDDAKPNIPLRDLTHHFDVIHFLGEYPLPHGISSDTTIKPRVDNYVSLYSNPAYYFCRATDSLSILSSNDMIGFGYNRQAIYSHLRPRSKDNTKENFIHIEVDEYPDALWTSSNPQWSRWLPKPMPADWNTYAQAVEYFQPLISSFERALYYSEFYPDSLPPTAVNLLRATQLNGQDVYLRWNPRAEDPFFESYIVYYDTAAVTANSPQFTAATPGYENLSLAATQTCDLRGLLFPASRCR
ncbi:MAG: hypothetical protein HY966_06290, partial [Ignavibacteriales bacterium]|nr:hypothetical protein [Ignavibacteriales bacterium]